MLLKRISCKIVTRWVGQENITKEIREIYEFGLEQIFSMIISLGTVMVIGFIMEQVLLGMIYILAFMFLRCYAGGYHASTQLRCYLMTIFTTLGAFSAIKYLTISKIGLMILLVISSIVICLLSPVDTENNRIDELQSIYYRKKALIIWAIEVIIVIVCIISNHLLSAKSVVVALTVISVSLVSEKLKNQS